MPGRKSRVGARNGTATEPIAVDEKIEAGSTGITSAKIEETFLLPIRRLVHYFSFIVMDMDCKHLFVAVLPDDLEVVYEFEVCRTR
jgi:hypothetical protein